MICDIKVSAAFSITVTEDYYSELSSVMWIREQMKLLSIATNNIAEWMLVEQQKG
jgi:phage antirepressor YoqD-like protein